MIKKDIFNHDVKAQFKASAKDRMYRFLMADDHLFLVTFEIKL